MKVNGKTERGVFFILLISLAFFVALIVSKYDLSSEDQSFIMLSSGGTLLILAFILAKVRSKKEKFKRNILRGI